MIVFIFIFLIINLIYWIFIFSNLSFYNNPTLKNKSFFNIIDESSVLIAAKNEEKNLKENLKIILNQKPSGYSVVVIDDHSSDNTLSLLRTYKKYYPQLIVLENLYTKGKKYALTYAIDHIDKKYLLFSDADCYVKSDKWLNKMVSNFDDNIKIILGYSPYEGKDFLSKFIRFETLMTAIQYFSYTILGIPYMGVGRNMAVERSFFIKNHGYQGHFDIQSGNDDLFVNANANSKNTAIQIDPDTFVYSNPPKSLSEFIRQKTRHISTSFRYKMIHKILLSVYSFSHIGVYLSLIIGLFFIPVKIILFIWLLRLILILIFSYRSFVLLNEKDIFIWLPILDFLMFVYYFFMGIYYFFATKNKWK